MNAKQFGVATLNFLLFWVTTLAVAHFQGILWFQFFGTFPAPALWLLPMVYMSQHRRWLTGLLQVYLLCLWLATVTVMPAGLLMTTCALVFITTMSFKGRIYWEGAGYQMLIAAVGAFSFNVYHYALSWIFEPNPILYPQVLYWIVQIALTASMSPLFQHLFEWFDHLTGREPAADTEMQAS